MGGKKRMVQVKVAKVIMLGASSVGKTSLVIRWNTGHFEKNTYSTIGAAFSTKRISFSPTEKIQLNVWDTSGSEKFDSMTKLYYRDSQAAILCFEPVDECSLERARYWAEQLRSNEPACRIYLVATKSDLLECDGIEEEVTSSRAEEFRQQIGARTCFRTSSKTGEGVSEVFDTIALHLLTGSAQSELSTIQLDADEPDEDCFSCFD